MHRALPVPDEAVWRHVTAFQQDICENVVIEACTDQGSLLFPKVEFFLAALAALYLPTWFIHSLIDSLCSIHTKPYQP